MFPGPAAAENTGRIACRRQTGYTRETARRVLYGRWSACAAHGVFVNLQYIIFGSFTMPAPYVLLDAKAFDDTLRTLARSLAERREQNLALVGIQRRGVDLAGRLQDILKQDGVEVPLGTLDITLYRDDWTVKGAKPAVGRTQISFAVEGKTLVLVDDVLYTGRTVRAALEALADFGRPGKVELLVLVDRGLRELPIHADYAGLTVETTHSQRVDVFLNERDGRDEVLLVDTPDYA